MLFNRVNKKITELIDDYDAKAQHKRWKNIIEKGAPAMWKQYRCDKQQRNEDAMPSKMKIGNGREHETEPLEGLNKGLIQCLFFADDIALMAKTKNGLRELLKLCSDYATDWYLPFNPNKSELLSVSGIMTTAKLQKFKISQVANGYYKYLGIPFSTRMDARVCCGSPINKVGYRTVAQDLANKNAGIIKETKVKLVLTDCPACMNSLQNTYAKWGVKIKPKIVHFKDFFLDQINSGKLRPEKAINKTVTYHIILAVFMVLSLNLIS